ETVERSFADAKRLHGYRYARMRGIAGMREQALLCAAAQNLKKMALAAREGPRLDLSRPERPSGRPISA
ncbi:transposase, partial [Halomonas sp. BBD45]|uniref:transposase n=1 Tax=Halomonas sp. BBD45 TaxID=1904451 RepID=UPI00209DF3F0